MRLALTLLFVLTATVAAQPDPEGAWGYDADMPQVVAMTGQCSGFVIGRGTVNAAGHEILDGSFNLSNGPQPVATVIMPRGAVALLRAQDLDKQDAELVLRPIKPRALEVLR